jgi:hypothetical protein
VCCTKAGRSISARADCIASPAGTTWHAEAACLLRVHMDGWFKGRSSQRPVPRPAAGSVHVRAAAGGPSTGFPRSWQSACGIPAAGSSVTAVAT